MRIFKLEHLPRFLRVFHLLTTIGEKTADLEFYNSGLKFVVVSHHLAVILHIRPPFLLHYQPPNSSKYLRIRLGQFCDQLRDRLCSSSSVDFNLFDLRQPPLASLTFHDDSGARFSHILRLLNSENRGNFGEVTTLILEEVITTKFVSIDSEQFNRIVMEFINIDKVAVVLTNSQVTFSSEFKMITFNVEDKECIIGGVNAGERIEYSVKFKPTKFFSDLAFLIERVWFYHETVLKANIVMSAPIGFESRFVITFLN